VPRKLRIATPDPIDYPERESEFEVQAYIYHTLKGKAFDVRGEVTSRLGSAVLDLVVYDGRKAALVIEVKAAAPNARVKALLADSTQEQLDDYRRLGVPVTLVCGMAWAIEFCKSFKLPIVQTN